MDKSLQIAFITLVVLIGIYFLNNNYQTKLESSSEAIFNDDPEDIFKILIQKGEEAIELSRIDTLWRISGNDTLEVIDRSMDNLFDKVFKVNRGTVISENPKKYNKYAVDDSTGIHLAIINSKGETVGYYIFGHSKSDYSRSYVRINEDPKVYLTDQNVTYMLSTRASYWGEKPKEDLLPPSIDTPKDTTRN